MTEQASGLGAARSDDGLAATCGGNAMPVTEMQLEWMIREQIRSPLRNLIESLGAVGADTTRLRFAIDGFEDRLSKSVGQAIAIAVREGVR